ncbi:MAG: DUF134 domain-containing protein [Candidatus Wukongarchaeota archaeon]|jgi:predicted DNA-binding protein (UPF0251 family)|nr:DUF134 domain-containing protein [Candidatus Wukongarchaeota archaeon]MDO8128086.1 DUF134 domain-containing protein [Candidatus Wukongarchaeota archaeon]
MRRKRHRWHHRCGKGLGRIPKRVLIEGESKVKKLIPEPCLNNDPIFLDLAEYEALRLADLLDLHQEHVGARMGISRGTVWRLLDSARKKLVKTLVEGRPLHIIE